MTAIGKFPVRQLIAHSALYANGSWRPRPCENYPWAGMSDGSSGLTELLMSRFIEGQIRSQSVLFPEQLGDWISEDNPVRAIDVFVEALQSSSRPANELDHPPRHVRPTRSPRVQAHRRAGTRARASSDAPPDHVPLQSRRLPLPLDVVPVHDWRDAHKVELALALNAAERAGATQESDYAGAAPLRIAS